MTKEIIEHLENLKNSPIVDSDLYGNLSNLCEAIKTISNDALSLIEMISKDDEKGRRINENLKNKLERDLFQIDTLAGAIEEKLQDNDYVELGNLFFYYNNTASTIEL
ncbi:MAG TPA: hypothetical protein VMU83_07900 [Hanamia sp.]|nr:hypothetical protein [Hanamia sp.]